MEKKKALILILILAGRLLDGVTTHIALPTGYFEELNPIAVKVLELWGFQGMYVTLVLHAIMIYAAVEGIEKVCERGERKRPKWGWFYRGVKKIVVPMVLAMSWLPVVNNVIQMLLFYMFGGSGMEVEVEKHGARDREVYIPVSEARRYRVIIRDKATGAVIKEMKLEPIVKRVRRGGKVYEYLYLRIALPWASTISRVLRERMEVYNLVIEVM